MAVHYSPIHHGELTNHLPMYQHAMQVLGLPEQVIRQRSETYVIDKGLKNLTLEGAELNVFEEAYLEQVNRYREQLASIGIEEVLKAFLKDKKDAMASGLFHGMIRLAFAVERGDAEEIARALSYFHVAAKPMVLKAPRDTAEDLTQAWNGLMEARMTTNVSFDHSATMIKIAIIQDTPALMDKITQIVPGPDTDKRMCYIFANWYMKTRDFYVLHVITGYYALLQLKPYIVDFDQWVGTYWQMAQVISLLTTERLPIIKMSVNPWEEIMEEAHAMTDVHDVKLFYACKGLHELYGLKILNMVAHILSHKYWGRGHH